MSTTTYPTSHGMAETITTRTVTIFTKVEPIWGDTAYGFSVHGVDTDIPDSPEARAAGLQRYTRHIYRVERSLTGFAGRQWTLYRRADTLSLTGPATLNWHLVRADLPSRKVAADHAESDAYMGLAIARKVRHVEASGQPLFTVQPVMDEERPWQQWQEEERPPRIPTPDETTWERWCAMFGLDVEETYLATRYTGPMEPSLGR